MLVHKLCANGQCKSLSVYINTCDASMKLRQTANNSQTNFSERYGRYNMRFVLKFRLHYILFTFGRLFLLWEYDARFSKFN